MVPIVYFSLTLWTFQQTTTSQYIWLLPINMHICDIIYSPDHLDKKHYLTTKVSCRKALLMNNTVTVVVTCDGVVRSFVPFSACSNSTRCFTHFSYYNTRTAVV